MPTARSPQTSAWTATPRVQVDTRGRCSGQTVHGPFAKPGTVEPRPNKLAFQTFLFNKSAEVRRSPKS